MVSWEGRYSMPLSLQAMWAEQRGKGYSQLQQLWAQAAQLCLLGGQGCLAGSPANGVHLSDATDCTLLAQAKAAFWSPLGEHAIADKGISGRVACGMGPHSAILSNKCQLLRRAMTHSHAPLCSQLGRHTPTQHCHSLAAPAHWGIAQATRPAFYLDKHTRMLLRLSLTHFSAVSSSSSLSRSWVRCHRRVTSLHRSATSAR